MKEQIMWNEQQEKRREVRQIGIPEESDCIYIEERAYRRLHKDTMEEKRAFLLLGHNERTQKGYATVVEAVVELRGMTFVHFLPEWTSRIWNIGFREIQMKYAHMVIVGWALDLRGHVPVLSKEMEAMQMEQFGGARQIFLLMDSLETEENFYRNHGNRLCKHHGFWIYKSERGSRLDEAPEEALNDVPPLYARRERQGRYRQEQENAKEEKGKRKKETSDLGAVGAVAVVLLLLAILGTGLYRNQISRAKLEQAVEALGIMGDDTQEEEEEDLQQKKYIRVERAKPGTRFDSQTVDD